MTKHRFVLDSNVLISAALSSKGNPRQIFSYILAEATLLSSGETFLELSSRLRTRKRFKKYLTQKEITEFLWRVYDASIFIPVTETVTVCPDPDDDKFLALAMSGKADFLITGNRKDFPASPFEGIQILTPTEFVALNWAE